ncbi:MAG: FixH family protein [Gammaproteobacteria bacterium]
MSTPPQPWYREPIAWLVFAIPVAAVLGGIAMLWVSISTYDGPVVDDYYRRGLAIDRVLARDERAAALGLSAELVASPLGDDTVLLSLALHGSEGFVAPGAVTLKLLHATRSGLDRELILGRSGDARFSIVLERMEAGSWHAQLEADDWRLTTRLIAPLDSPLSIRAAGG